MTYWDAGTAELLEADQTMSPSQFDARLLNDVVWVVVRDPEAMTNRYRVAARLAEIARPQWNDYATLNTLGVARYRVGDYRGAVEALTASDKVQPGHPTNLVFLALAHHR